MKTKTVLLLLCWLQAWKSLWNGVWHVNSCSPLFDVSSHSLRLLFTLQYLFVWARKKTIFYAFIWMMLLWVRMRVLKPCRERDDDDEPGRRSWLKRNFPPTTRRGVPKNSISRQHDRNWVISACFPTREKLDRTWKYFENFDSRKLLSSTIVCPNSAAQL